MPLRRIPIDTVLIELTKLYPDARCTLDWTTPLDLLVATILAAQCTDARVNIVTKTLFKKYRTPQAYLAVPVAELEQDIHSCGTYRMKARAIQETCMTIMNDFAGAVPKTMDGMLTLRGVGRKTASVVLSTAFGIIEGIPVDTHCIRLSRRLGLTKHTTQARIERDLMNKAPRSTWTMLSHLLVFHGRQVCVARSPKCNECVLRTMCPSSRAKGEQ